MCDEILVYASACVLRNKMACAMKLDYNTEEVRSVNLTHSFSPNCAQRQDTGQDVWSWVQVRLTATVTCNQYYLLSCGAGGAR